MKSILTITLVTIIVFMMVVIIGLLIHCKVLSDRVVATKITYEEKIEQMNIKKVELEEGIRNLIDQSNVKVIEGETREKVRIEYVNREIDKVIFTPTYSNICLDFIGLSAINTLITEDDSYTRAASEPTSTMR